MGINRNFWTKLLAHRTFHCKQQAIKESFLCQKEFMTS